MNRNGKKQVKAAQREREKQRDHEVAVEAMRNGDVAIEDDLGGQADFLRELTATSLAEPSKQVLENLLSRDFILGNLQEEDFNEIRWELRILEEMYGAMHPPPESIIQGEVRQYVFDEEAPQAGLESLTEQELLEVKTLFRGIANGRVTRARDMKQQEMMSKSITESHVKKDGSESSGGVIDRVF